MITLTINYHELGEPKTHTVNIKGDGVQTTEAAIKNVHTDGFYIENTWVSPYTITKIVVS